MDAGYILILVVTVIYFVAEGVTWMTGEERRAIRALAAWVRCMCFALFMVSTFMTVYTRVNR